MSVLGLITEYNPFHNGHLYHLNESKKITNCQYSVCVMSGNFIQRGEPALIDKWVRTKMALEGGVDLVIELPVLFSLQSAELFSYGSIKILDSLGIVDSICFGSEAGNIDILDKIASILCDEPLEYKMLLKNQLDTGMVYPKARAIALSQFIQDSSLEKVLNSSNNILGIEYLKALKKIKSSIKPFTIERINNKYNSSEMTGAVSSATSIRQKLYETENIDFIRESIPETTYNILLQELYNGKNLLSSKDFNETILSLIRKMSLEDIKNIFDVNEGLENKIKSSALKASSIDELIQLIKSKRFTQTRIQRILFHILLGVAKNICNLNEPQYIRVLGFNENGKKLLSIAKKKANLPIITKVSNFKNTENKLFNQMLNYDILSTDLYTLGYKNPLYKKGSLDFTHNIIIK